MIKLAFLALLVVSASAPAAESHATADPADDIRILDRASELLSDENRWNRKDTRECPPRAQTLSLFCALHAASIEVLGQYDHRRAALEEVRLAIEELSNSRRFEHRLMDFNNLAATTFSDVKKVLAMARARIAARRGAADPPNKPLVPTRTGEAPMLGAQRRRYTQRDRS